MNRQPAKPPQPDTRSLRTREALRRAILALLERKALEKVTIRDLVSEAAISYATFFRHYPDKEALLDDVTSEEIGRLMALTLPLLNSADTRASARALSVYVWENRALWAILLTGGAAALLKAEFVGQMGGLTLAADDADTIIPTDLRITFCVAGILEILAWWLEYGQDVSIDQMAEIRDRLLVSPRRSQT